MPLTQDQKNWLLKNKGFDPQKFYVDEDRMEIMPMQSEAPANAQMAGQISAQNAAINADPRTTSSEKLPGAFQKPTESSTVGALGRSARSAALPTLGGLALGGLAAAPFTGGTSLAVPIVASILGGVVGGVGTSLAQEKAKQMIYSKDTLAQEEAQRQLDVEKHPIASKVGEFVPQAIAMRPSPKNVYKAGKLLAGGLKGATPEAAGNLANIALGGTLGGVQSIAQPLIQGQPVRGGDVAASIGAGLFLNQPTAIGRLFMPKGPQMVKEQPTTSTEVAPPAPQIEQAIMPKPVQPSGLNLASGPAATTKIAPPIPETITAKPPSPLELGNVGITDPQQLLLSRQAEKAGTLPQTQSIPKAVAKIPEVKVGPGYDVVNELSPEARLRQGELNVDAELPVKEQIVKPAPIVEQPVGSILGEQTGPRTSPKIEELKLEATEAKVPSEEFKPITSEQPTTPYNSIFFDAPEEVRVAHGKALEMLKKTEVPEAVSAPETTGGIKIKVASPETASLNLEPLITVGKHIYKKYQDFAKWADELRYVYGEGIKPYLSRVWSHITGGEKPLSSPALKGEATEMPRDDAGKMPSPGNNPEEFQSLPGFRSMVDEIATHGKTGNYLAGRVKAFLHTQRENIGKYVNKSAGMIIESKLPKASRDKVNLYAWEQRYGKPHTVTLNAKEQKLLDNLRQFNLDVHADQRAKGILVGGVREAMDDPNYWQGITSNEVGNILDKKPNSPEATKLKQDWVDHVAEQSGGKISKEEARQKLNKYLAAKASDNMTTAEFNAIREAEGYGVPWSWQEKDLNVLFDKYGKRVSRDFAYYDEIQTQPEARRILNRPDQTGDFSQNPEKFATGEEIGTLPKDLLEETNRWIGGKFTKGAVFHEAVNNFARSGMIGALTATKNIIGNIGNRLPYIPVKDWTNIGKGLLNLRKGFEAAARQGVIRRDMNEIYNQVRMHDTMTDFVNKQANRLATYQLVSSAEKFDRAWMMSDGMMNAMSDLSRIYANKGKVTPGSFIDQFKYKSGIDKYLGKHPGEVPPEIIEKIAANYVERVQGTYDPRGVPRFAMKGNSNISPYFSLARWGMENFNNFQKDIIAPAIKRGDYSPLLKKIFGTFLSGTALSYVVKEISNRKDFLPKLDEALKSEDPKAVTLAIINIMKLGSFAGIASDIIAAGTAVATHRTPMGITWPAMNMAESTVKRISQAAQAIGDGENALQVLGKLVAKLSTDNVQTARIAANHTWLKDEAQKANSKRDLQFWEYLSGTGSSGSTIASEANPFTNPELRNWRKANTPEDIVAAAGPLAERTQKELSDNPLRANKVISRLQYSPQFPMPNPETDEPRAAAYYEFIRKTQGEEAATEMVSKWRQQKEANKMRRDLIGN